MVQIIVNRISEIQGTLQTQSYPLVAGVITITPGLHVCGGPLSLDILVHKNIPFPIPVGTSTVRVICRY